MHHRFIEAQDVLSISSRELEKKNKREEAKQPAMLPKDENAVTVRCINKNEKQLPSGKFNIHFGHRARTMHALRPRLLGTKAVMLL
ncbi:hypothetical protein BDFG_04371 [Blastomyces dermatitidis ATCC 26199]|nr:hypothetical protein BDFG_04371 [Blastomyces dermatitidis ATCC 26199]